jgi:cytochrome c oxidase subunit 2
MDTGIRLFPEAASRIAGEVDLLFFFLVTITAFFTALIFVLVVSFALGFRRRSPDDRPKPVATDFRLEIAWTGIPLLITVGLFLWGAKLYVEMTRVPADAMEISVIGKQWMWKVEHPEGRREINELHVPVGRKVVLHMTSEDVIHDFFCPEMRVKHDVLPGRYTTEWFEPIRPGKYHLFCSMYCGAEHAEMVGSVYVMEPAAYQAWLTGTTGDEPPAVAGARIFAQYSCNSCHGVRAPTLANLYGSKVPLSDGTVVVADDDYLRESIVAPRAKIVLGYPAIMPTFKGQLSEEQIIDLIAYIKSLGNGIPGGGELAGGGIPAPAANKGQSTEDYITQTPYPNVRSLTPSDGPGGPDAKPVAPQTPDVPMNTRPSKPY